MNASKEAPIDELKMSGAEFDKLMRKALQVGPEEAPKRQDKPAKVAAKVPPAKKAARKTKRA